MTDKEKELQAEAIGYLRKRIAELEKENAELKGFQDGAEFGYNKGRNEAKEILQVVLDKWKEERWILQSEEEVRKIETLMEQAEQFLKE